MSNGDGKRFGFRPVRYHNGAPWTGAAQRCWIDADYAVALYIGDAVMLQTESDYLDPLARHKSIMVAADGDSDPICGIIVAFGADPGGGLDSVYAPATYEGYAWVVTDPEVIFQVRDDGSAVPAKTWVGGNANLVKTHSGNTATGISGMELQGSSIAANDSYQLYIENLADIEDNTLEAYAIWEVRINCHQLARNSTSDGTDVGLLGVVST